MNQKILLLGSLVFFLTLIASCSEQTLTTDTSVSSQIQSQDDTGSVSSTGDQVNVLINLSSPSSSEGVEVGEDSIFITRPGSYTLS